MRLASELEKLAPAADKLGVLEQDLASARKQLSAMALRLEEQEQEQLGEMQLEGVREQIDALGERLGQLEPQLSTLGEESHDQAEQVARLEAAVDGLREADRQREKEAESESWIEWASEQDERLTQGLEATAQRLQGLETAFAATGGDLDAVKKESRVRAEQVNRLVTAVDRLRETDRQREQDAQDSTGWIERANEQDERLRRALEAIAERLQGFEQEFATTGGDLDEVKKEIRVRAEQVTRLVTAVDRLREADRQREQDAQDSTGWIERANAQDERLRQALEATAERLQGLEAGLDRLREADRQRQQDDQEKSGWFEQANAKDDQLEQGLKEAEERLQHLETALDESAGALDSLRQSNGSRGEEIIGLESAMEELRQWDSQRLQQLKKVDEELKSVGEVSQQLKQELSASEARLQQLEAARVETENGLNSLGDEGRVRAEKVAGLESVVEELRSLDGVLDQQLRETARHAKEVEERHGQLEQALEASSEQLQQLKKSHDATGAVVSSIREQNGGRDQKVSSLQSRLQTLTWSVAAALVALTAGTLMYVGKHQTQREVVEYKLNQLEQRLNVNGNSAGSQLGMASPGAEGAGQVQNLTREIGNLNTALTGLSNRIGGISAGEGQGLESRLDAYDREKAGIIANLDDLGERLAQLESRLAGSGEAAAPAVEEPLIPPVEKPAQPAAETPEAQPAVESPAAPAAPAVEAPQPQGQTWQNAREQKRFTLQLLGVQSRSSLVEYARKHQMLPDSAALETQRDGKPWFVLLHGIYEKRSQAKAAVRELAVKLPPGTKPWVRRIPRDGNLEALE